MDEGDQFSSARCWDLVEHYHRNLTRQCIGDIVWEAHSLPFLLFANTPMLHSDTLSLGVMIIIPCKIQNYSSH